MQRKKYNEEQIIQVLKEREARAPVAHLCRKVRDERRQLL